VSDLLKGRLEQMCPDCGRWEAAHRYCSWCLRRMGPDDWYRNSDLEQRHGRMPKSCPARPPSEYLNQERDWPKAWGPYPRQKPLRRRVTPIPAAEGAPGA
jgi:hypothetical protein